MMQSMDHWELNNLALFGWMDGAVRLIPMSIE